MTAARDGGLDLEAARERFEASTDFTMAIEEEFAILDPETLELAHGFERLFEDAQSNPVLAESIAGELIDTEVEIRSGRSESFAEMLERQQSRRALLFELADRHGKALAACGTHPWADYLDQTIIDTPHYRRLRAELGWVAQRNNTWSLHVHVGVRGPDRAIAVCDHLRNVLPTLLAASANSNFLDGQDTGLHSVRTQIFTRTFPRCGIHDPFGDWDSYADFVGMLEHTGSIVESTQLWWSVRPHHRFGTVEVRICDAQSDGRESFALAGLMIACVAQAAIDYDSGVLGPSLRAREVEENLWRAIRYGLDGRMIDFDTSSEIPTREALERLFEWTTPARGLLGIDVDSIGRNSAQRSREAVDAGTTIPAIYRDAVDLTRSTYLEK